MKSINDYLPPEMLVKIFSYYLESEGPLMFVKNVSPVCKLWRDLCSTSSLWKMVSWKSVSCIFEHLLRLGERGYLASTRYLDLSNYDVYNFPRLSADNLIRLIQHCRNVKSIDVSYNEVITEEVMLSLSETLTSVEKLVLRSVHCDFFQSDPSHCPRMVSLSTFLPILNSFGKTLRYLYLKCHFASDNALISKIGECCPSLEEFSFINKQFCARVVEKVSFPIDKIQSGCPKLRVLEFDNCKLELSNELEIGFRELKVFVAEVNDFRGFDVVDILKNSTELEHLHVYGCDHLTLNHISKIPSNKMKILKIGMFEKPSFELDKAVKKWRRTLKDLSIGSYGGDFTSMIKAFLDDNQSPVIERIYLDGCVALPHLKSLIRVCKNLKVLCFETNKFNGDLQIYYNREEVEKLLDSS